MGYPEGGYDPDHAAILAEVEDRHFWFRARNTVIRAVVSQVEPSLPSSYRVLELGCGTGNTLRVLAAACRRGSIVGMDAYREGFAFARQRLSCPLVQGDLRQLPFHASVRFDLVAMFDVLEHIPDDVGALAAVRSRLAGGGRLLLTVPAGPELWSGFDVAARHCRRYTAATLEAALTSAGYALDYVSPFMVSLYPIVWLRRRSYPARSSEARHDDAVRRDLRIVPVLNGALTWLLEREAPLIALGRHLPGGTSLLAIARGA